MPANNNPAIVTIVSNNYLHFARTMLQSAKQTHPEYALYCVVVDRDLSHASALSAEFETISLDRLGLPLADEFLFQYTILELNTAVKAWAIEYLLAKGHYTVIYVDPDIRFYSRMHQVEKLLSANADIVLTPHLLAPVTDDKQPRELDIRRAGAYNLGFCALRDSSNTRSLLRWWQLKLTRDCVNDTDRGLFVDQGWMDLVPGLFDNVAILKHVGYNVAYWNIAQRALDKDEDRGYFIEEEPLIFFHFSGVDPSNPETFSKHQTRFTLSNVGLARELVEAYIKAVVANGYRQYVKNEYGFGYFSTGEKIPDIFRNLYRLSSTLRGRMGPQPFTCWAAVCDLWTEISIEGISPTNAMMALWYVRHDVQSEFPLNTASSIMGYYRWFVAFPPGAQHYPPSVIAHHIAAIRRFEEQATTDAQGTTTTQRNIWPGHAQRVHFLYKHLLNRTPDQGGFHVYGEMCKTDAGFVRAWGEIGLSQESKSKPFLWFRMARALLVSMMKVDQRFVEIAEKSGKTISEPEKILTTGVFPAEVDVATHGVWVSGTVGMAVSAQSGDRVCLEGVYFPESIARQTGNGESTIKFMLGNEAVYSTQIAEHGDFVIEFLVPELRTSGSSRLAIESSKTFTPKSIGEGDDERILAWRMKRLTAGTQTLFDCKGNQAGSDSR